MIVGVPKERFPGETRVALVPAALAKLRKSGLDILIEAGAGAASGYPDAAYVAEGAEIVGARDVLYDRAEIILRVRTGGAEPTQAADELALLRAGQRLIGMMEPLGEAQFVQAIAERGVEAFALELIPRISRAQSMDVLSSMATLAGYKAVLLAANNLQKIYPLMMTAAGTLTAARVLVVGVGVAGLQAIATSRRLGAIVEAYDIRPAVKEQVQSLGAKFVELELEAQRAESEGGYAQAQGEAFYQRQRQLMAEVVARNDVVMTTASVPGKAPPTLITAEMVHGMAPGSIIVDLAAERGGNCALTQPGQTVEVNGVKIMGPVNLPATVPFHASQMYSRNIATFLLHLLKDERDADGPTTDEIVLETRVTQGGQVVHPRLSVEMAD
ncbi:MAG: Re/Si-specific NAD(P)(+) transhydrogenase subunit alpha [Anaerolineales bacterium]|nr:Re/Si-specific NAD(P)(+) transhydrogenase subunit alpha [Anaerolineales bacterium]MCB9128304.1 Re/Si-specific NAD(P)(+) transhydrogenase subunit alpha [Ardenticatenales bacterium]